MDKITQAPITQIPLLPATSDSYTATIETPTNILSQQKSAITTNPFISDIQKQNELTEIQKNINETIINDYNKNATSSISNLTLSEIHKNISISCIGLMNDLLDKPKNVHWVDHVQISLKKNQRYAYIGILCIIISLLLILIS